jgi:hypothetical protein
VRTVGCGAKEAHQAVRTLLTLRAMLATVVLSLQTQTHNA